MLRILVVENDGKLTALLTGALSNSSCTVSHAPDYGEALRFMDEMPINLVIIDISTPDMEALEFIRSIRHCTPNTKMIALSGAGNIGPDDYLATARTLGANAIFTRPIEFDEFLTTVKDLLASRKCLSLRAKGYTDRASHSGHA